MYDESYVMNALEWQFPTFVPFAESYLMGPFCWTLFNGSFLLKVI